VKVKGAFIRQIRVGIHKGPMAKVRAVLDLVPDKAYKVAQRFFEKENIYELTLKTK